MNLYEASWEGGHYWSLHDGLARTPVVWRAVVSAKQAQDQLINTGILGQLWAHHISTHKPIASVIESDAAFTAREVHSIVAKHPNGRRNDQVRPTANEVAWSGISIGKCHPSSHE